MLSLNMSILFSCLILISIVIGLLFILPSILKAGFYNYNKSPTIAQLETSQKSILIIDEPVNCSSMSLEDARVFANISTPQEKIHGNNTHISKSSLLVDTKAPVSSVKSMLLDNSA